MELDAKISRRPDRDPLGQTQIRSEAGKSGQQAEVQHHRGGVGTGRRQPRPPRSAELGYNVQCFCFQDSPRRAHSIAAQGGINAAKNYHNDGDSIYRLFYDTVKGGDFRSREANVYRLAQISVEHHRSVRGAGRALRARVRRACWTTAPSAARRCRARFTRAARPGSNCCWALTRRWSARSAPGR